jgi:hypothetical protein
MPKKRQSNVSTVRQIEEQVFEREGIRIVIRLPGFLGSVPNHGLGYNYERALGGDKQVAHLWFRLRRIFGGDVPFVVVRGDGKIIEAAPGGGRLNAALSTIRNTYA